MLYFGPVPLTFEWFHHKNGARQNFLSRARVIETNILVHSVYLKHGNFNIRMGEGETL